MPGKSHGQRSLVGYSPWGRKESDIPQAELFVRQRERPGLPSQALAWPPRLSAGRRESGSQRPWLGEASRGSKGLRSPLEPRRRSLGPTESPQGPRDRTRVSCTAGGVSTTEPLGSPLNSEESLKLSGIADCQPLPKFSPLGWLHHLPRQKRQENLAKAIRHRGRGWGL